MTIEAAIEIKLCDIDKIFGFYPQFLAHRSQNPWNFLSVESGKTFLLP